ncbi:MAG TPA: flagellar assembly protein FliW [Opitutaceae bacterium]|jgi:flagellar assembly factor FliW|nr:flagellar assembly protein FliW [Opitutaceae bacterium]HRE09140.1 flagellar assembly protein FliW [Opitutaceae bacterium]
MKVSTETATLPEAPPQIIRLPEGLVGFPDHTGFELLYSQEQLPFRWLRLLGAEPVDFVVIEPAGIIADYELELFDEDAAFLGISDATDALVLNIVTVSRSLPPTATVNLVGPVIINRRLGIAKQVVLANHSRYSARHPLVTSS